MDVLPSPFCGESPKEQCDYFWTIHWPENLCLPFSCMEGLLFWWKIELFYMHCVVEASSSSLNPNMTLESKGNFPQHTKTVQTLLDFMPEVKPLHKSCGDLLLCTLKVLDIGPPIKMHYGLCMCNLSITFTLNLINRSIFCQLWRRFVLSWETWKSSVKPWLVAMATWS